MALLKFNYGIQSKLNDLAQVPINDGNVYITTDSQEMRVDIGSTRYNVSDFVFVDSIDKNGFLKINNENGEPDTITNYYTNLFYYVKGEEVLRNFVAFGKTTAESGEEVNVVEWSVIGDTSALTTSLATLGAQVLANGQEIGTIKTNLDAQDGRIDALESIATTQSEITVTKAVGAYTVGQKIPVANLQKILIDMISEDVLPTVRTSPGITITFNSGSYEVGEKVTPSYTINTTPGVYKTVDDKNKDQKPTFTFSDYNAKLYNTEVKDENLIKSVDGKTGSFDEITITLDTKVLANASADYESTYIPLSYLGVAHADKKIADGTATKKSSAITGHRKYFYGTLTSKSAITSEVIRNLTNKEKNASSSTTFNMDIPVGAMRAIIAYPKDSGSSGLSERTELKSVKDSNASDAQINSAFTKSVVQVEGANHATAVDYYVYVKDWAEAVTTANVYKVEL